MIENQAGNRKTLERNANAHWRSYYTGKNKSKVKLLII